MMKWTQRDAPNVLFFLLDPEVFYFGAAFGCFAGACLSPLVRTSFTCILYFGLELTDASHHTTALLLRACLYIVRWLSTFGRVTAFALPSRVPQVYSFVWCIFGRFTSTSGPMRPKTVHGVDVLLFCVVVLLVKALPLRLVFIVLLRVVFRKGKMS
jgi:hypothetical protein